MILNTPIFRYYNIFAPMLLKGRTHYRLLRSLRVRHKQGTSRVQTETPRDVRYVCAHVFQDCCIYAICTCLASSNVSNVSKFQCFRIKSFLFLQMFSISSNVSMFQNQMSSNVSRFESFYC